MFLLRLRPRVWSYSEANNRSSGCVGPDHNAGEATAGLHHNGQQQDVSVRQSPERFCRNRRAHDQVGVSGGRAHGHSNQDKQVRDHEYAAHQEPIDNCRSAIQTEEIEARIAVQVLG
jgi:hypothetical protein